MSFESRLFRIGMWWRILYGTMRIIVGVWLLNLIDVPLAELLHRLMQHELTDDPNDLLFQILNALYLMHSCGTTR